MAQDSIAIQPSQVDGNHYDDDAARCPHCDEAIQHWDLFGHVNGLIYAATKYLARLGRKPGEAQIIAVEKSISYLQKYIVVLRARMSREKLKADMEKAKKRR